MVPVRPCIPVCNHGVIPIDDKMVEILTISTFRNMGGSQTTKSFDATERFRNTFPKRAVVCHSHYEQIRIHLQNAILCALSIHNRWKLRNSQWQE